MSEYGFQSFPEFASVKKYTIPEDWDIESEVMAAHQRSGIGNLRIRQYMENHYIVPEDFEQLLYVGQLLQAKGIRMAIEAHRSDMHYCMGSLYWQLNDVWPVASWSGIDYYGKWKALHYAVKEAYKNTVVFVDRKNENIQFKVVSDLDKNSAGKLEMKLMDFDGNMLWSKSLDVQIPQNSAEVVFELPEKDILKRSTKNNVVLVADLEKGRKKIDRTLFYFVEPKDLNLPEIDLDFIITKEKGEILISVKSNKLVKNLMLINDEVEARFSDNYFDVLPGEEVTISIKTTLSPKDFEVGFKWLFLEDTMKNH
jgi:beta-mannosidase